MIEIVRLMLEICGDARKKEDFSRDVNAKRGEHVIDKKLLIGASDR